MDSKFDRKGLGFLFNKCTVIKPSHIRIMLLVPEYVNALKVYSGDLNDDSVYRIVCDEHDRLVACGNDYRNARQTRNKIERDIIGAAE